jgi:myo-inositol-1(or 4)-monophosphatase
MAETDIQVRMQVAKQATHIAGEELRRRFLAGEFDAVEAERASREAITVFLSQIYPTELIWGRGMDKAPSERTFWVFDSLNGAENFSVGDPFFSSTVAWVQEGQPMLGVVSNPMHNQKFTASFRGGALLNGKPVHVRPTAALAQAHILGSFASLSKTESLMNQVKQLKVRESPTLDMCSIAGGVHDAFLYYGLEPWEWIAAKLIVEEAGGTITDLQGQPLTIRSEAALISNKVLHNELLKLAA